MDVSIGRIAGQLRYLFDDHPELRNAPADQLCERLNHDDRFARAREKYPLRSDAEIKERVAEFDARIAPSDVRAALDQVEAEDDGR